MTPARRCTPPTRPAAPAANIVMYNYIANYPLFVNQLTTFAYIPTSLLYVIPMIRYRPDVITPEARAVPQKGA